VENSPDVAVPGTVIAMDQSAYCERLQREAAAGGSNWVFMLIAAVAA
jgi:hypothetical protein